MRTRVVIVEDPPQPASTLLDDLPDITVVGQAYSEETARARVVERRPDVVLLDGDLPGLDLFPLIRQLRCVSARPEILVRSVRAAPERAAAALRAGAAGYVVAPVRPGPLAEALRAVAQGGAVVEPRLARALLLGDDSGRGATPPWAALSPREIDTLRVIARGLSNAAAAAALGVTPATVRTHLAHIFDKLDVANRVEAVAEGIRRGLIEV